MKVFDLVESVKSCLSGEGDASIREGLATSFSAIINLLLESCSFLFFPLSCRSLLLFLGAQSNLGTGVVVAAAAACL